MKLSYKHLFFIAAGTVGILLLVLPVATGVVQINQDKIGEIVAGVGTAIGVVFAALRSFRSVFSKIDSTQSSVEGIVKEVGELRSEVTELRDERDEALNEATRERASKEAAQSELSQVQVQLRTVTTALNRVQSELSQLRDQFNASQGANNYAQQISETISGIATNQTSMRATLDAVLAGIHQIRDGQNATDESRLEMMRKVRDEALVAVRDVREEIKRKTSGDSKPIPAVTPEQM